MLPSRPAGLASALRARGPGLPVMVVDLDALDANIATVQRRLNPTKRLRLVAKSLPCLPLLAHLRHATGARDHMVFHAPHLAPLLSAFPGDQVLVGKPLPVQAVEHVFAADRALRHELATRVIWLVDTHERLAQYTAFARRAEVTLRVALEIEIGMRRGGFGAPYELDRALTAVIAAADAVSFAGLMGYDAHVGAVPRLLQDPGDAHVEACDRYAAFVARVRDRGLHTDATIYNGAGSRTFHRHDEASPLTEISIGSAFVLPARFDGLERAELLPAIYLAVPVLRAWNGTGLPGLSALSPLWPRVSSRFERSYFLYGGRWDAVFAWPPGLRENTLYGGSYNQTLVNGPRSYPLEVDDYAMLRPNDSEQVMLQFDEVWAFRGDRVEARWPTLRR